MVRIGEEVIPQVVGGKPPVQVIVVCPHDVPAGFRELVVIHLDHPAGNDRVWRPIPCTLEKGRPEDAVVVDDIPADKMGHAVLPTPEGFPVVSGLFRPLLGERDVPDGGIHPHVDDEIVPAGKLHPPVERAGDAPVVQVLFHPPECIVSGIQGSRKTVKVLEQELLELAQFEEVVFLIAKLGLCLAYPADRVPNFSGLEVAAASLVAFIAPGLHTAMWAGPLHVAIWKETATLRAIALLDHFGVDESVLCESFDDLLRARVVCGIVGHPEMVEFNLHPAEGQIEVGMVAFRHLPWGDLRLFCTDHDGRAVVVRTADEYHLLASPPQVPDVAVGGDVGPQVPDVTGAISIRKAASHQNGLLTHHYAFDDDAINN
ncbi:MAG: hypothetical protein A4E36_00118 [Methanoregulaceae archaeon PtaB.Bin009]|nr:MAG: hypothetical protein A4E36_00118 [Methanoregulaceae archaeon PtaB.Bin009]